MALMSQYLPGMTRKFQAFTTVGSGTNFLLPPNLVGDTVFVTMIGGGGGGAWATSGSANCSGGNGGEAMIEHPYTIAGTITPTVGAGGAARAGSAGDGTAGGSSTFGTMTVLGGSGGRNHASQQGGSGSNGALSGAANYQSGGYQGRFGVPRGIIFNASGQVAGGGGLMWQGDWYGYGGSSIASTPTAGVGGLVIVEWWEYA